MKASDIRNLVIISLMVLGGLGFGLVRYLHHRQWAFAYTQAQYAVTEAWIHRDGSVGEFDPWLSRAEEARFRASETGPWGKSDYLRQLALDGCLDDLHSYRTAAHLVADGRSEGRAVDAEWKIWSKVSDDLHSCVPAAIY